MKVSILVPVYNERALVERSLDAVLNAPLPEGLERELVVVDDCSTDGTGAILARLAETRPQIRLLRHGVNQGKGAAVRTAIQHASGDFCLIQDADLEYDPADYPVLLRPLLDGHADAVFGSRYLAGVQTRVLPFWHSLMNRTLTLLSNMFSNLDLTDMETCYKVFRTDLLKSIPIRSDRFGIEPELTMKCAKRKLRIYEVPISYHGRTYEEGKKIGWKDGLKALGAILYFWLVDDLYVQPYGFAHLNNLTGTPQYVSWLAGMIRPHLGDSVLEVSAGIGTLTGRLMGRRARYVAAEYEPLLLHALKNRFLRTPNVEVRRLCPDDEGWGGEEKEGFDTVLAVGVLEYCEDPAAVLRQAAGALRTGGTLVVVTAYGPGLMGTVDRALGYRRRFDRAGLAKLMESAGLAGEVVQTFNKASTPMWLLNSKVLGARQISKLSLKLFDKTVWLWRLLDPILPWPGLSVMVRAQKPAPAAGAAGTPRAEAAEGVIERSPTVH
jgi:glycosyltransferase involved in cell wall biosynthesis